MLELALTALLTAATNGRGARRRWPRSNQMVVLHFDRSGKKAKAIYATKR